MHAPSEKGRNHNKRQRDDESANVEGKNLGTTVELAFNAWA